MEAVSGRVPVIIDGGVRHGTDILKALALGADLVFMGRPLLWGLTVQGQKGAENILAILKDELETDMMMCGAASLTDITRDLLVHEDELKEEMVDYLKRGRVKKIANGINGVNGTNGTKA